MKLKDLKLGDTFTVNGTEYTIVETDVLTEWKSICYRCENERGLMYLVNINLEVER